MARWKNFLQTSEEVFQLKRQAVLAESGRIFSRRGYHNTSLDDVAKALNVAKGTLYNYVRDKQEILFECLNIALDIGETSFAYGLENGRTGAQKLRLTLTKYISTVTDELGACGLINEIGALRPEDRKVIVARRDAHETKFIAFLEEGAQDGSLRKMDSKLAVYTFMGAINAIPMWYSPKGRLNNLEIADGMVDILMKGMAPLADNEAEEKPVRKSRRAGARAES